MKLNEYVRLSDNFFPKYLEKPYLLDKKNDELYELSYDAFDLILNCDGTKLLSQIKPPKRFFNILLKNSIVELTEKESKRFFVIEKAPLPSLRYLEVQLTNKCNLNCLHCYQGKKSNVEISFKALKSVLEDFVKIQGIRLILSGGEPLLYRYFEKLNEYLKDYPARVVLLTNGTLIDKFDVAKWNIDEVQISLDGMERGHDFIRGSGTFKKILSGMETLRKNTDIDISIATMIHKENLKEFKKMKGLIKEFRIKEWGIDFPVITGNLFLYKSILPSLEEAIGCFKYRFGASFHSTDEDNQFACGSHLMTLTPDGKFLPCGFFQERVFGTIKEGLINAVNNRKLIKLQEIKECRGCLYLKECRGGCRYRAGSVTKKDPVMCKVFGI
ncbi:MAG: radical SAM protein [Proteobacteria bacterium]|nr:radical SAM protein [Pseudomonadota bacterium]